MMLSSSATSVFRGWLESRSTRRATRARSALSLTQRSTSADVPRGTCWVDVLPAAGLCPRAGASLSASDLAATTGEAVSVDFAVGSVDSAGEATACAVAVSDSTDAGTACSWVVLFDGAYGSWLVRLDTGALFQATSAGTLGVGQA